MYRTLFELAGPAAPPEPGTGDVAPRAPVRFADTVATTSLTAAVLALWRRERALVALGLLGLTLAAVAALGAALNGSWFMPPEGRLLDAATFEAAAGVYMLTLALLVPLAGFSARGRRAWVSATLVVGAYFYPIEVVQALRGLDPRFSEVAGPIDQAANALFGVSALVVIILFMILITRFFRAGVLPDHAPLRLALRYGGLAVLVAFGVGLLMSALSGRYLASGGSLMPLHAAGFHGLQAVPLVALWLGWARVPPPLARHLTHAAGIAWLALCAGLALQAASGAPLLRPAAGSVIALAGLVFWASCAATAAYLRYALT
ncbi:MAG: hypothetical protein ACRELD_12095 [Longimicrobiales bacterium]